MLADLILNLIIKLIKLIIFSLMSDRWDLSGVYMCYTRRQVQNNQLVWSNSGHDERSHLAHYMIDFITTYFPWFYRVTLPTIRLILVLCYFIVVILRHVWTCFLRSSLRMYDLPTHPKPSPRPRDGMCPLNTDAVQCKTDTGVVLFYR